MPFDGQDRQMLHKAGARAGVPGAGSLPRHASREVSVAVRDAGGVEAVLFIALAGVRPEAPLGQPSGTVLIRIRPCGGGPRRSLTSIRRQLASGRLHGRSELSCHGSLAVFLGPGQRLSGLLPLARFMPTGDSADRSRPVANGGFFGRVVHRASGDSANSKWGLS